MKKEIPIFTLFIGLMALWINGVTVWEAIHALSLSGAAQAQADWDFYFTIMLNGPASAVLGLLGLQLCGRRQLSNLHPLSLLMFGNILIPFAAYCVFKLFW